MTQYMESAQDGACTRQAEMLASICHNYQHLLDNYYTLIYLHLLSVIITTILLVLCYYLHINKEKSMTLGDQVSCPMSSCYMVEPVFEPNPTQPSHLLNSPLQRLVSVQFKILFRMLKDSKSNLVKHQLLILIKLKTKARESQIKQSKALQYLVIFSLM